MKSQIHKPIGSDPTRQCEEIQLIDLSERNTWIFPLVIGYCLGGLTVVIGLLIYLRFFLVV